MDNEKKVKILDQYIINPPREITILYCGNCYTPIWDMSLGPTPPLGRLDCVICGWHGAGKKAHYRRIEEEQEIWDDTH